MPLAILVLLALLPVGRGEPASAPPPDAGAAPVPAASPDRGAGPAADPGAASRPAPASRPATTQPPPAPRPSIADLVGLTAAGRRLGEAVPTGRGIVVGHVEGSPGAYMPDAALPGFAAVRFEPRSGESRVFGHATGTAKVLYGRTGLAPGVERVQCFATNHWMRQGYLMPNPASGPVESPIRVFNHSWIAEERGGASVILRRVDHDVDARDVIYCVGVNNRRDSAVPTLLASAHNVIAVGTAGANGASSGGYTRYEGLHRCKPDLVGPRGLTSFTTPAVAACAARLLEAADAMGGSAPRSELIKAVLLAGAAKPALWRPAPGRPLDEHLGAGVVNLDAALRVLAGGPIEPGAAASASGWSFLSVGSGQTISIDLEVEAPEPLSIVLCWNRRIDGRGVQIAGTSLRLWRDTPRVADLDLRLIRKGADGGPRLAALSDSEVDNVEHVYFPRVPAGSYRVEATRLSDGHDETWDAALAFDLGAEGSRGNRRSEVADQRSEVTGR